MNTVAAGRTPAGSTYFTRFTPGERMLHAVLMITFLGLAATGLPLRFSNFTWSEDFAHAVGGFSAILFFHKFFAVILTVDFLAHVANISYRTLAQKQWSLLWGPNSMMPNIKDLNDFFGQMKWLVFLGPKPHFDRYTYLGEARLLGGVLGHDHHRYFGLCDVVSAFVGPFGARFVAERRTASPRRRGSISGRLYLRRPFLQ